MASPYAIELVTFHLVPSATFAGFVAANRDVDAWLRGQPGFRSRHIAQQDDGRIVDLLFWENAALARAAMHRLMDALRDAPVHAFIDGASVTWAVAKVGHALGSPG
jgi:hypothetical protein